MKSKKLTNDSIFDMGRYYDNNLDLFPNLDDVLADIKVRNVVDRYLKFYYQGSFYTLERVYKLRQEKTLFEL